MYYVYSASLSLIKRELGFGSALPATPDTSLEGNTLVHQRYKFALLTVSRFIRVSVPMSPLQGGRLCPSFQQHTPHTPRPLPEPCFIFLQLLSLPDIPYVSACFFYIVTPPTGTYDLRSGGARPRRLCSTPHSQGLGQSPHIPDSKSYRKRGGGKQAGYHPPCLSRHPRRL